MHIQAQSIICSVFHHGEHGAIVRAMTAEHGLLVGYVRGGRSRTMRPVLMPSNIVMANFRARTEDQMFGLTAELLHSRGPLMAEPLAAAALDWVTALTASSLPEAMAYPQIYSALDGVLAAIEAAPAARGWAVALVRYELLVLGELGFGLDLDQCVVTGAKDELLWISPKSGAAVSAVAGQDYANKLLRFPDFLRSGKAAHWDDIMDGLRLTGHFIARDIFGDHKKDVMAARVRLVERLKRAVA